MTTAITDERGGLVSASGFDRVVQCPASVQAERRAVESGAYIDKPNAIRDAGDRIHEALLTGELSDLAANEEQIATRIKGMEEQACEQWITDLGRDYSVVRPLIKVVREERFWVIGPDGEKITSAKVDVACIWNGHCLLLDAKSGFLAVTSASSNWQLRVGIVALDKSMGLGWGAFKTARVAIAQYRLKEQFTRCDYTRAQLDHAYNEIVFHDSRAKQPDAPYAAGSWCTYCKAKTICATYTAYSMIPSVRADIMGLTKKADIVARVADLTHVDLAFIHSRSTAAGNLFEAVKDRLKAMTDEQLAELGMERVATGSNPSAFDITAIWQVLAEQKLCTPDEFKAMCKVVLGDLKELVVPKLALRNECTKSAAEKMLNDMVSPHITYTPKSPSIKFLK